jgi:hypothetical protein
MTSEVNEELDRIQVQTLKEREREKEREFSGF